MKPPLVGPVSLALVAVALASAGPALTGARQDSATGQQHPAATVVSTGPTIIAAFPTTQSRVDNNPGLSEALSDFQYYLPGVRDSLRHLGVTVIERYDSLIPIREASARWVWRVTADSGGVGYMFLAPSRRPRVIWGVATDVDLFQDFGRF